MYPNYNYYPQQLSQYAAAPLSQPQPGLKGRPVSSLEEVRAANIDFDGSLFIFPDLANKKIYTKQINMDGTATLNQYELSIQPSVEKTNYITRDEFDSTISQLKTLVDKINKPKEENKEIPLF